MMEFEFDQINQPEWDRHLEGFEDASLYQTWAYGAVRWGGKNLSHAVMKNPDGGVAAMAQLRIVRPPLVSCGIAYLRWGPVCQRRGAAPEDATIRRMVDGLHAEYVRRRGLFLRVVPKVVAGSESGQRFAAAFAEKFGVESNGAPLDRTYLVDLSPPLEQLRKNLDQKWRNQLNRAEKNELTLVEGTGPAEYAAFKGMYYELRARKGFDTSVDVEEFGRICEALPESLKAKIILCQKQGVPVAGIVCTGIGDTGIYLLGATSDAGLQAKGAYLLQWSVMKWLKEKGCRYYDLGGIDPVRNPGVYHFKSGLSGDDVVRLGSLSACQSPLSSLCVRAMGWAQAGAGMLKKRSKPDGPTDSKPRESPPAREAKEREGLKESKPQMDNEGQKQAPANGDARQP